MIHDGNEIAVLMRPYGRTTCCKLTMLSLVVLYRCSTCIRVLRKVVKLYIGPQRVHVSSLSWILNKKTETCTTSSNQRWTSLIAKIVAMRGAKTIRSLSIPPPLSYQTFLRRQYRGRYTWAEGAFILPTFPRCALHSPRWRKEGRRKHLR